MDEVKTDCCSAKRSQTTGGIENNVKIDKKNTKNWSYKFSGYLVVTMPKLNYVPPPKPELAQIEEKLKIQKLEVKSKREQEEMDFSKICENNDLPPDLEPID